MKEDETRSFYCRLLGLERLARGGGISPILLGCVQDSF